MGCQLCGPRRRRGDHCALLQSRYFLRKAIGLIFAVHVPILAAVTTMLALTLLWPFAKNLFRFGPLHFDDLAVAVGAGIALLVFLEFLKPHWYDRLRS